MISSNSSQDPTLDIIRERESCKMLIVQPTFIMCVIRGQLINYKRINVKFNLMSDT